MAIETQAASLETTGLDFQRELLAPGDPGNDDARRIWNGTIDGRPGLAQLHGLAMDRHAHGHRRLHAPRGIGWLMRKYGATVDNLLSVDLVSADGERVRGEPVVAKLKGV